jgi:hypothetical protein
MSISTTSEMQKEIQKEVLLDALRVKIESLEKHHHIEILKIIKKNAGIKLNENKNGIYINLSFVPQETVNEIQKYLLFVQDQENSLEQVEKQKEDFKKSLHISA